MGSKSNEARKLLLFVDWTQCREREFAILEKYNFFALYS